MSDLADRDGAWRVVGVCSDDGGYEQFGVLDGTPGQILEEDPLYSELLGLIEVHFIRNGERIIIYNVLSQAWREGEVYVRPDPGADLKKMMAALKEQHP